MIKMTKKQRKYPKHTFYDQRKKTWVIRRKKKGKNYHFGTYKTREEAEKAVEIYDQIGWDPVKNWAVKAKVKEILYGDD